MLEGEGRDKEQDGVGGRAPVPAQDRGAGAPAASRREGSELPISLDVPRDWPGENRSACLGSDGPSGGQRLMPAPSKLLSSQPATITWTVLL